MSKAEKKTTFVSCSLSLSTLLLEGDDELPGFDIMTQEDLVREELHVGRNVHVLALDVRLQRDFQALKDETSNFKSNVPLLQCRKLKYGFKRYLDKKRS